MACQYSNRKELRMSDSYYEVESAESEVTGTGVPKAFIDQLKGFDWTQLVAIIQLILKLLSGRRVTVVVQKDVASLEHSSHPEGHLGNAF